MKSSLKNYVCKFEKDLNLDLINKSADAPLVDYIVDALKSLEVVPQIKFISYEYTEHESEIDINRHVFKREKRKRKKDKHSVKYIADDRVGKLTVHMEITMLERDPETDTYSYQRHPFTKAILIPLQDERGLYYLKGKHYYLIYQMVEKSTYTSASSVTTKSLMPICIKRHVVDVEDTDGHVYQVPSYYVFVFKKEINVLLFYLAKGLYEALDMLEVIGVVDFLEEMPAKPKPDKIYFSLSSKCFIEVDRKMFKEYSYIMSIVGMFYEMTSSRITLSQLKDPKLFIKKIANPANYEKGKSINKYFARLADQTTLKILKLPLYYRQDIYGLLKWMMEEFNTLRLKDNCDINTKRIRCNEYIASLFTADLSKRLNRVISMGEKATVESMREIFKFPGDIIIQEMQKSGVLRFDDSVNDLSFFSKIKYTNKGPNSLGNKNSNNIGLRYRDLHPSFLGHVDILVCGNSDPGTSGCLSPFSKIKGLYFDNSEEPNEFYYNLMLYLKEKCKKKDIKFVTCEFDTKEDFYNTLMEFQKFTNDNVHVYGTSKTGTYDLVINEEVDLDDESAPNIDKDMKKKNKKEREELMKRRKKREEELTKLNIEE